MKLPDIKAVLEQAKHEINSAVKRLEPGVHLNVITGGSPAVVDINTGMAYTLSNRGAVRSFCLRDLS